jgi:RND family efflux transporter MFP subunit
MATAPALRVFFACLLLAGCEPASDAPAGPASPTRPVKLYQVTDSQEAGLRRFAARIDAAKRAELSFRVPGTVREFLVREGEMVQQDQAIARLDATDLNIVLADRQAAFDNARRNFARAGELVKAGNISRVEFDRLETSYKSAEAALKTARQNVSYTELKAPFAGMLAKRHVQRFEEVGAKQAVASLQQTDQLDVKIDLPESLLRSFQVSSAQDPRQADSPVRSSVEFDGLSEQRFDITLKEIATKADPDTQTFEVTFTMPNPRTFVVLPGMTATVTLDLSALRNGSSTRWVPATAVGGDIRLDAYAWVLDPATMTLAKRPLRVGRLDGDRLEVLEGLVAGEEVVELGLSQAFEGMKVTRLETNTRNATSR